MGHDLETAKELQRRQVNESVDKYFEFVRHRLEDAISTLDHYEKDFEKKGDWHSIKSLAEDLSKLNLGFDRAISCVHKLAILEEEVFLLEEKENENDRNA